ncbi:hypothetical protein SESBI_42703 [Sesbania bispinosa]|nr:hypothetical protein SESBI_42703 [Sesbania bispinosa]
MSKIVSSNVEFFLGAGDGYEEDVLVLAVEDDDVHWLGVGMLWRPVSMSDLTSIIIELE